ncbi:hypothetical protein MLD38_039234 [Melastoma candidum]|uniref:Uncharacterized protein n=1 Tax=Melastoma candidum TaxID=119954 RepID=A0ACB9L1F2_9MYRT|nr:hypothetical protein MLD38_039234 [Melastoma candidum]
MASVEAARTAVGVVGNVISLFLFLSPMPTIVRIWKKGSVEQYSAAPYLATLMNCMMWVLYGLPMVNPNSTLIVTINGAGTLIEIVYITTYLINADNRKRLKVIAVAVMEVAFVLVVFLVILTVVHTPERRSTIVGIMCIVFACMMYAAPLSVMRLVITTKSVEYMPFCLSLAGFANGICWTTYALIKFDLFVAVPNGIGTLFGLAQLVLYGVFFKSTKEQQMAAAKLKETSLSEVVVDPTKNADNNRQNP